MALFEAFVPAVTAKAGAAEPAHEYKTPMAGAATPLTVTTFAVPFSLPVGGVQFVEAPLLVVSTGKLKALFTNVVACAATQPVFVLVASMVYAVAPPFN